MEKKHRDPVVASAVNQLKHDLLNLLTPAMLTVELLLRSKNIDERTRRDLLDIQSCHKLMADFMAFIKIDAGTDASIARTIDAASVFKQAIRETRMRAHRHARESTNIRIHFTSPLSPVCITTDELGLHRTLLNLLANALQAITPGVGSIICFCDIVEHATGIPQETYEDYQLADQPYVLLRVTDTGCGMTEGQIRRAHREAFTEKPDGHGLGLVIVRDFVKRSQSGLHIESRVGHGTTFTIYHPMAAIPLPASSESGICPLTDTPVDD